MNARLGWIDAVSYAVYLAFLGLAVQSGTHDALWIVGLSLSVACAAAWFLARWQLGTSFSVGAEARKLVTTGLYAKVRHPVYVFGTMSFMFALLALEGWSALLIWVFVIAIQLKRASNEDRVLAEAFGPEYEEYRRGTWL